MRCAFFDWRDEVQKKSKKQDIELAALLFLVGLLLFIYPVVNQVSSYHTDEEEYEDLAMQFMQPEVRCARHDLCHPALSGGFHRVLPGAQSLRSR